MLKNTTTTNDFVACVEENLMQLAVFKRSFRKSLKYAWGLGSFLFERLYKVMVDNFTNPEDIMVVQGILLLSRTPVVVCKVWWWLWSFIPCLCFFFFFLKWRLPSIHTFHSVCQDQSTVAQQTEMTVANCSLLSCVWACFLTGYHAVPGQRHSQPTPTLLGQGCVHVQV